MKAIKTIVTVNDQEVTVWLEPQEAANYIHEKIKGLHEKIEGLHEKIEGLRSLSPTEMADETAKSVLPKLKKVPPTELLKEYTFAELKTARRGESLAGFLTTYLMVNGHVLPDLLRHNEPGAALIRRPNGLTDKDWDWLVNSTTAATIRSGRPFMREMVEMLLPRRSSKPFAAILKSLGIEPQKSIDVQNWEHTAFRFFRHFCPEDFRNAMNHSGLKFATLEFRDGKFVWTASVQIDVVVQTEALSLVAAEPGDTVTVTAEGQSDVETVTLTNGRDKFQYYEKGRSKAFGDTMYMLKHAIIKNKKERYVV